MVTLTINNQLVTVPRGTTILEAAQALHINIPTLCYLKELNEAGACRICVVEAQGEGRLLAACNTEVAEGMVLRTNTEAVRQARKTNLELILSRHDSNCPSCPRNENCSLQHLAGEMNVGALPFEKQVPKNRWDRNLPLIREDSKCISCLRCINVCDKVQDLGVWDLTGSGAHSRVSVQGGKTLDEAHCSLCGQCITHCPVGALHERDDTEAVFAALADPDKTVVVQVAPAVRAAWGDSLGLSADIATQGRMTAALRALGADYVFDTNFAADLTIMEEGSEFIQRMTHRDAHAMPMLTSCCPGWVRFLKMEYPSLLPNLSSAKSPQQMFGAVAKSYFAEKMGIPPEKIFCVSVMPCTAKKYECAIPEISDAAARDVDAVITTREFGRMLRAMQISVATLPEEDFDSPLGEGTGAAVIFGVTGGVMEAAVRSAYYLMTGQNPQADDFAELRGREGWRDKTLDIQGTTVRLAIASGLGNARRLLDAVSKGEANYDFIEIMACPGGCAGGGGQPICDGFELADQRGERLYALDKGNPLRFSHENASVQTLYREYLEAPLSHKSHQLLHTHQQDWSL